MPSILKAILEYHIVNAQTTSFLILEIRVSQNLAKLRGEPIRGRREMK